MRLHGPVPACKNLGLRGGRSRRPERARDAAAGETAGARSLLLAARVERAQEGGSAAATQGARYAARPRARLGPRRGVPRGRDQWIETPYRGVRVVAFDKRETRRLFGVRGTMTLAFDGSRPTRRAVLVLTTKTRPVRRQRPDGRQRRAADDPPAECRGISGLISARPRVAAAVTRGRRGAASDRAWCSASCSSTSTWSCRGGTGPQVAPNRNTRVRRRAVSAARAAAPIAAEGAACLVVRVRHLEGCVESAGRLVTFRPRRTVVHAVRSRRRRGQVRRPLGSAVRYDQDVGWRAGAEASGEDGFHWNVRPLSRGGYLDGTVHPAWMRDERPGRRLDHPRGERKTIAFVWLSLMTTRRLAPDRGLLHDRRRPGSRPGP
jgi:hypothetical protein